MNLNKEAVLSLEDCKQIINNYLKSNQFEVLGYEVKPFSDTVNGFLGEHLLLTIKIATNGTEKEVRFFAKRFPFNQNLQSLYASSINAFPKEIFTYQVIFEEFQKFEGFSPDFAPKCYFAKDNLIVFEDLSEKGFVSPEDPKALPLELIKSTLDVLAKYHAGSIGYQELQSKRLGKKYKLLDEYAEFMQEPLFRKEENFLGYGWCRARLSALNGIVDLLPEFQDLSKNDFKQKLSDVAENSFEILRPKEESYNVLCHGDLWGKNVMFRHEESKLVDFQLQRYGPPAHDVLQFIYLTTNTERRKNHLHELLRYYHDRLKLELQKGGIDLDQIVPFDHFETSVHYLLPQIKLQTAFYHSFLGGSADFYKTLIGNVEDFNKFDFVDGAPFSKELFKTDPKYARLMTETLNELKDLVTNPRITLEDCFKIIPKKIGSTNYNLLEFSVIPLAKIGGFLGDHYKLKIIILDENQDEQTLRFFAKCAPANKTRYQIAMSCGAFFKESFMIGTFSPWLRQVGIDVIETCTVPWFLIRPNDVIIFADLEFEGYQAADPRTPFDFDHLQVVLEKLATYHATNIILEEKLSEETGKKYRLGDQFASELEESFFPEEKINESVKSMKAAINSVDHEIDLFPNNQSSLSQEEFKIKSKEAFRQIYEIIKPSQKYRNVICHGDLWASNLMIKHQDDGKPLDCLIIDYQIMRYCPPAHDLLCVLYLTTTRKTRAHCMRRLIDLYYKKFSSVLAHYGCNSERIYTYADFLESCDYMTPQAVCQTVLYYQFTMTNSDLMKEYTSNEESTRKIFVEDRKDFITDMCRRDPIYRDRMLESIEDLREMCLKYF